MRVGLLTLLLTVLMIFLIGLAHAFGGEKPLGKPVEVELGVSKTIDTITFILKKGLPKHRIYPWIKHPLLRKPKDMHRTAKAIYDAATLKKIPVPILIAIGFREGSFRPGSIGKIGELSMFQMVPSTAKAAQELEPLCTLDTLEGSAICSATWLGHWREKCGSWEGSFSKYATGKTCKPVNDRVEWMANDRVGITKKLTAKFWN